MPSEMGTLPCDNLGRFAVALCLLGPTLLALPALDEHLGVRWLILLVTAAVGLPCLMWLSLRKPGEPDEDDADRSGDGASRFDAARVQLAARLGVAFALWCLLSTLLSGRIGYSFFGNFAQASGCLLLWVLVASWAIGVVQGDDAVEWIEWALLAAVGLNAAGVAVIQTATGAGWIQDRAPGLFPNPVILAQLLIGGLWLVARRFPSQIWAWGAAATLVAAGIQCSGSRFALFLIPVALVGAFVVMAWRHAAVLSAFVLAGVVAGALLASIGGQASSTERASAGTEGVTARVELWRAAPKAIADLPLLGSGPGRSLAGLGPHRTLEQAQANGSEQQFIDAHNIFVELGVSTGLVGLALFVAFLVLVVLLAGWRSPLAGFALLAFAMQLVEPLHNQLTPIVFLAFGAAAAGSARVRVGVPAAVRAVLVGVAVLVALPLAYGTFRFAESSDARAAQLANAEAARRFLPFWNEPFAFTADLVTPIGDGSVANEEQLHWREVTAEQVPEEYRYWAALALDELNAGRLAEGEAHFRRALQNNPWSVSTNNGLGLVLVEQGRSDEAVTVFERSLVVEPDQPEVRALLEQLTG